jgi:cbb3-type cytochrome oxidase subunit 3
MKELIISNSATIATIFFFSFFCYVIYSVFKKGSSKKFAQYSQIPLHDDPAHDDQAIEKITTKKHKNNKFRDRV